MSSCETVDHSNVERDYGALSCLDELKVEERVKPRELGP